MTTTLPFEQRVGALTTEELHEFEVQNLWDGATGTVTVVSAGPVWIVDTSIVIDYEGVNTTYLVFDNEEAALHFAHKQARNEDN